MDSKFIENIEKWNQNNDLSLLEELINFQKKFMNNFDVFYYISHSGSIFFNECAIDKRPYAYIYSTIPPLISHKYLFNFMRGTIKVLKHGSYSDLRDQLEHHDIKEYFNANNMGKMMLFCKFILKPIIIDTIWTKTEE